MAELTGFEPAVSCVTGRHVRPLHHSSKKNTRGIIPCPNVRFQLFFFGGFSGFGSFLARAYRVWLMT